MVSTTKTLTTFNTQIIDLLMHLANKESLSLVTDINKNFKEKYKAEISHVTELLDAIEVKFKRCETLYYLYFENADHSILSRASGSSLVEVECTILDGTAITEHYYKVDDQKTYKDIIDHSLQTFILCLSSLYENLVLLAEIFIKKVVIYLSQPQSVTLNDYYGYHKKLMDLGYRANDDLSTCLDGFNTFSQVYLEHIRRLRNSYIHGFLRNTETDTSSYYIQSLGVGSLSPRSPALLINIYTEHTLNETRSFVLDLLATTKKMGNDSSATIPS